MESGNYNLEYRLSQGNMHIHLSGNFDESLASECIACVSSAYQVGGRIFLDTRGLAGFCDRAVTRFKEFFVNTNSLASQLYLKGEQGFKLLPEGGKVLVMDMQSKDGSSACACGGTCGGANAKSETNSAKPKCKVCKCSLARERASQRASQTENVMAE